MAYRLSVKFSRSSLISAGENALLKMNEKAKEPSSGFKLRVAISGYRISKDTIRLIELVKGSPSFQKTPFTPSPPYSPAYAGDVYPCGRPSFPRLFGVIHRPGLPYYRNLNLSGIFQFFFYLLRDLLSRTHGSGVIDLFRFNHDPDLPAGLDGIDLLHSAEGIGDILQLL